MEDAGLLQVNRSISIPLSEFDFSFSRSSGPGGQNVNKVNTKVTLRWHLAASESISAAVRARFMARYARRVNSEGVLLITSQRYRDQGRNVADCLAKLRELLLSVAAAPKTRKPTRPTRSSKERRLREKKQTSQRKQSRRNRPSADD